MDAVLEDYMEIIEAEAQTCFGKLRTHAIHEPQSLVHEGIIVFYESREAYNSESEASFATYLFQSLRNKWKDILHDAYRSPRDADPNTDTFNKPCLKTNDPEVIVEALERLQGLNLDQKEYVTLIFNPPEELVETLRQARLNNKTVPWKTIIRQFQGHTYTQDLGIRKSIETVLC